MDTISNQVEDEFKLDLSTGKKKEPNKFDHLADNTLNCLVQHGNTLNELYHMKDEIMEYSLPPSLLLQILLLTSRTSRSFSDVSCLVKELIRLVQQYSVPWEEKGEVLKKLREDYLTKQNQLSIAINHLKMLAVEEEHMKREKRLNNWMKLYMRTMASKSVGRRWKFRIEPFKRKLEDGYNPYLSESDSDEEEQYEQHRLTPSDIDEDELRDLASDRASELSQALSSKLGTAALMKRVQFAGLEEDTETGPDWSPADTPPGRTRPLFETSDKATWTNEPEYNHQLMVIMYKPQGILARNDVCYTVTVADSMFVSKVYKTVGEEGDDQYQVFRFPLSDDQAQYLPHLLHDTDEETDLYVTPKITIAVYRDSIANDMTGHCSVLLPKLVLNGKPTVVIPPINPMAEMEEKARSSNNDDVSNVQLNEEGDEEGLLSATASGSQTVTISWEPDWEGLVNQIMVQDPEPVVYPVKVLQDLPAEESDDDDGGGVTTPPCVPMVCQVVQIQRHNSVEIGISTQPWESLVGNMGYKRMSETANVALSALMLDPSQATTPARSPSVTEVIQEPEEEEEKMSAIEVAQLTLRHAEELKLLQDQYNAKLQVLSKTLARVKSDKQREVEQLEEALLQSEAKNQHRMRSPSELREMLARKRKLTRLTKGLPEWGKNLPENFYERLELFAHESMKRNAEMTEKIKREVKEVCERQMESLHRLAPNIIANPESAINDVCIPALFMPTPTTRPLVFNPRAHNYFHPPGSDDARVTQPPAIFKLPPVNSGYLSTMNLYQLSQREFQKTGPEWLLKGESPCYTPAPPPSACDYYLPPPTDRKYVQQQTNVIEGEQ